MELFEQDSLILMEFYGKPRQHLEPEKRLMLGVLEDAITDCFQKYLFAPKGSDGENKFRSAEEWIMDKNNEWLFSFNNICETLGLNPSYVRAGLQRWKEKQLQAAAAKVA